MKKPKVVKPFLFKDLSKQDVVDYFNEKYPVNIKYNESLVNKVHERYPLISKTEISVIVRAVFESFRDLLILGKVLNFNNLFFDTKLFFFARLLRGHILTSLRVKISTPPKLRKNV